MPRLRHFYGEGRYYYLTEGIYRRARIFDSDRFKRKFVQTLDDLRTELRFKIFAYVLMPEDCHLLIWPKQSGGARVGGPSGRLALVKLEILLPRGPFPVSQGPPALSRARSGSQRDALWGLSGASVFR